MGPGKIVFERIEIKHLVGPHCNKKADYIFQNNYKVITYVCKYANGTTLKCNLAYTAYSCLSVEWLTSIVDIVNSKAIELIIKQLSLILMY